VGKLVSMNYTGLFATVNLAYQFLKLIDRLAYQLVLLLHHYNIIIIQLALKLIFANISYKLVLLEIHIQLHYQVEIVVQFLFKVVPEFDILIIIHFTELIF